MARPAPLLASVALIALAACQPSTKPQPLTGADSTAIDKVRADYAAAFNGGNVDALVRLHTSDVVNQAPDVPVIQGATALQAYFNKVLGTPTRPKLDITQTTLLGRQDLAVSIGTFTVMPPAPPPPARGAAPAPPAPIGGKYVTVLTKQADGSWKIAAHAMSYDAPMPATPAPSGETRQR